MRRLLASTTLLILLLIGAGCASGSNPAPESATQDKAAAKAEKSPDKSAKKEEEGPKAVPTLHWYQPTPDAPRTLAAHFKLAEGWHIYWVNPGETGLPTKLEITGPEALKGGKLRYPVPHRFESPGPVLAYGYEEHAGVFLELPAAAPEAMSADAKVEAKLSWLACRESCIREQASLELAWDATSEADTVEAKQLAEHFRALPAAAPSREGSWSGNTLSLPLPDGASDADFFPYDRFPAKFEEMVKPEAPGAPMKLRYSIGKGTIQPNQGVLHYKLNGEDHAVEIALDWPAS